MPTRTNLVLILAALFGCLVIGAGAAAFPQYSQDKNNPETYCRKCHGDFNSGIYLSKVDGSSWDANLMDVHSTDMLNGDCSTCHSSGPRFPVVLGSSAGGTGLDPISCAGCHGRMADGTGNGSEGYGAGLRQRHWRAEVTTCGQSDCHEDDSDPALYEPVGENIPPEYYALNDPDHLQIPSDPCNLMADGFPEDYAGSPLGLDNDGNGLYDEMDIVACPEPGEMLLATAGALLLGTLSHRRLR